MIKRLAVLLALFAVTSPLYADFGSIARAIDAQRGVRRVWIPFFGLARTMVRIVDPSGVHDVQLAVFEGRGQMSAEDLNDLMRRHVGKGFTPLVRAYSKKKGEWSFIYARPLKNDRLELMVLSAERDETVLVRVEIDAEVLGREMNLGSEVVTKVARR